MKNCLSFKKGDHICFLYDEESEHQFILSSFFAQALQQDVSVLYLADTHSEEKIQEYLIGMPEPAGGWIDSGRLRLNHSRAAYNRSGIFDAQLLINWVKEESQKILREPGKTVWITCEMSFLQHGAPDLAPLLELSVYLEQISHSGCGTAFCQFQRSGLNSVFLLESILSHPLIMVNGHLYENRRSGLVNIIPHDNYAVEQLNQWLEDLELRRKLEEELRITRLWVESVHDAVFWIGQNGQILYVNKAVCERLGYNKNELLNMTVFEIDPHFSAGMWGDHWENLKDQDQYCFETEHLAKDGRLIPVELHVQPVNFEGKDYHCVIAVDITERKAAEQRIRLSEGRFRLLVEGVRDHAIFMLDPEGKVVNWNAGAERLLGYQMDEVLGQDFSMFYKPEDIIKGMPKFELALADKKGSFDQRGWRIRKDGSRFWAFVVMTAVHNEKGELTGYIKVTRDISEQKRRDEDMRAHRPNVLEE
jgi:PAS domain S-box-containing protein